MIVSRTEQGWHGNYLRTPFVATKNQKKVHDNHLNVVAIIEELEVKVAGALAAPKPHRVDNVVLVAGDGGVVGHGVHHHAVHPLLACESDLFIFIY